MTDTARVEIAAASGERDAVAARLLAAGALGTWEHDGAVVAWFDTTPESIGDDLDTRAVWSLEADRDWQAEWKATIGPVRASRTVVVPSWLAEERVEDVDTDIAIVLDPGRAFGSGHHATTTLCLELLEALDDAQSLAGRRVADVGCGSGILAIAAALRDADVTAVDIDPAAIAVTRENAAANGVTLDVRLGGPDVLDGVFDVVVANLITDTVAELADALAARTAGWLVVSGIAVERAAVALDPLRERGLHLAERWERDGWLAAALTRDEARTHAPMISPAGTARP